MTSEGLCYAFRGRGRRHAGPWPTPCRSCRRKCLLRHVLTGFRRGIYITKLKTGLCILQGRESLVTRCLSRQMVVETRNKFIARWNSCKAAWLQAVQPLFSPHPASIAGWRPMEVSGQLLSTLRIYSTGRSIQETCAVAFGWTLRLAAKEAELVLRIGTPEG